VRAVLDLIRENGDAVPDDLVPCRDLLQQASQYLTMLDPELGGKELVKSVAAELAKLTAFIAENSQRQ